MTGRTWREIGPADLYPRVEIEVVNVPAAPVNCTCHHGSPRCRFCREVLRPLAQGEHRPFGLANARRSTTPTAIPRPRPGQRVVLTDHIRDGEVLMSREHLFIGCWGTPEPRWADVLEHARDTARWAVRRGMADRADPWLLSAAHLWDVPATPPDPKPLGDGERLYARLSKSSPYPF